MEDETQQSGLASEESTQRYSDAAYGIQNSCMSAEDRIQGLTDAANRELQSSGVPPVGIGNDAGSGNLGSFDFQTWNIDVDPDAFSPERSESATPDEQADAANTIYHEARHTEQWYRMAQEQAGMGSSTEQVTHDMSIPSEVAQAAASDPYNASSSAEHEAAEWNQSVYGSGSAHREDVLNNQDSEAGVCVDRYDDYRRLPEEADAWSTGNAVSNQFQSH